MKSTNLLMIVAVVAVSLAAINLIVTINKVGDIQALTGYATDTATANLTVQGAASITFVISNISWGSGYVNESPITFAVLDTVGNTINGTNWATVSTGLTLRNDGNNDVTINLSADKNSTQFIGGTAGNGPIFQWNVSNAEEGSCSNGGTNNATNITSFTDANITSQLACWNLSNDAASDLLRIDLRLEIPQDAAPGAKGVTITANATTI
ncbi:MAG TPA: hypothetical protein ENG87_03070 [Candidatus Pacearchaeota archaeon]|nr:hypothetical protein BMS3Abin17_00149 [archaeon BMS3Abin17]HDK42334.1 hypothetical protein [Candidatus Pacearchaeota archaeon]HDZ60296.1 hypothetical protein [Candidatus Pacearchaeota archaeon]